MDNDESKKSRSSHQKIRVESGGKYQIRVPSMWIESIAFESAHDGMHANYETDNWAGTDWACSGEGYSPPHWEAQGRNVPVSHTCGNNIRLRVQLQVQPSECRGELIGMPVGVPDGANGAFAFRTEVHTQGDGPHLVEVVGDAPLPDWPRKIDRCIQWRFEAFTEEGARAERDLGESGPHTVFATFGPPINTGRYEEEGATRARMEEATRQIAETAEAGRPAHARELIRRLLEKGGRFILGPENVGEEQRREWEQNGPLRAYMEEVDWPQFRHGNSERRAHLQRRYLAEAFQGKRSFGESLRGEEAFRSVLLRKQGGAWPLASLREYGGECQAIARLLRGILYQVGFREGTIDMRYLTADFREPTCAILGETGAGRCRGPRGDRQYALISADGVRVGHTGTAPELGANGYEAFIRYRYREGEDGYQAWYAGGVKGQATWKEAEDGDIRQEAKNALLQMFKGMAECRRVGKRGDRDVYTVTDYHSYQ